MKTKYIVTVSGLIAMGLLWMVPAKANMIYSMTDGNSAISGYTGPYGTVTVDLTDSTHATVTFNGASVGGYQFLFGGAQGVDVNVNASSWSIGSFTETKIGTGFATGDWASGGFQNAVDGHGSFNQTVDNVDGFAHAAGQVSFILTDLGGIWASEADVLLANADGYSVDAHIFVTPNTVDQANGALATGYAGDGGVSVPDGGSTALLMGIVGTAVGCISRRLRPVR